jgi:DNA-binding MarR family transcriptional regulator
VEPRARDESHRADRPSDDALEVGKLVIELVHVAYATRDADASRGSSASGHDRPSPDPDSPHAIRAAIHVYQHGERTVGEIADGLGISLGWASRVVTELESAGMVRRTTDPSDRRIVRIKLTPRAMDMVEGAYRWRADAIDRALARLDAPGRAAVRTFLRAAVDELDRAGRERIPVVGSHQSSGASKGRDLE